MRTEILSGLMFFSIIGLAGLAVGIPFFVVVLPAALLSWALTKLPFMQPKTL